MFTVHVFQIEVIQFLISTRLSPRCVGVAREGQGGGPGPPRPPLTLLPGLTGEWRPGGVSRISNLIDTLCCYNSRHLPTGIVIICIIATFLYVA